MERTLYLSVQLLPMVYSAAIDLTLHFAFFFCGGRPGRERGEFILYSGQPDRRPNKEVYVIEGAVHYTVNYVITMI